MAANYQMLFELNAALGGGFTSAFTQGSQQIENMKAKLDALNGAGSTGDLLGGISAALETAGVIKGLEAVYDSLKQCAEAAAAFETAMAGVKRTVGGDDAFIEGLGESFKKLSTEIPITADELAGIATTAGQLGIAQNNVEVFTTVMAQLGTTTDLTADSAATMLAQFANITGTTDYERLGSTVAALGDSTATTASKVVEMSQGMAAAASQAGMSERDILAISAAVGSLGIEAASGSTSMSTLISTLYKATETGNKLEEFASVAGMSADQFKESWGKDAVGTMNAFIQGLNDTERNGRSAVVILDELGIKNVRQTKAILGLASAGDLLTNTISLANSAWEKNTALGEKAGVMYNTTEAKLTMMENAANNVKISIGDALTPMIAAAAEGITNLLQPIAEFIEANPALVQGITAFVSVLGLAVAAIGAYTAITKLAAAANLLFAGSIPGLGIILAVAAGVGALVAGISALVGAIGEANPSFETLDAHFDELNEKAKEQQHIVDLAEEYKTLTKEIADLESQGVGKITEKIDISEIKKSDLDLLKEIAENKGYIVNADGTVTQTLDITGVSKQDLKDLEKLKTAYVEKKAKLTQELELLGITDVEKKLPTYLAFKTNTKEGTYALKQQLEIDGAQNLTDAKVNQLKQLMNTVGDKEGKLSQKLELLGFDKASISALGYSSMEAFVEAVQSGKIVTSADGTLTQKLIMDDIKPEKIKQIEELKKAIVNEKATLEQELKLRGVEDVAKNMDTYLSFKTNTKDGSYALEQQLELDGAENITPEQLKHLKEFINSIQTKTGKLTQTLTTSGFDAATIGALGYSTMEDFVAAVEAGKVVVNANGTITQTVDVSGDLEALREANEQEVALAEAQNADAAAAEALAEKKERLKAVTEELRNVSGGLVTATDEETDALNRQVSALESVARARKDQYTNQALDTIKGQSQHYVDAAKAGKQAYADLQKAQAQADVITAFLAQGDAVGYLREQFQDLQTDVDAYEGTNWLLDDNDAAASLRDRFLGIQDVLNSVSTFHHDLWDTWIDPMGELGYAIENDIGSTEDLEERWKQANEAAAQYADAVEANDKTQKEYLQNLINGVTEGTMTTDQLRMALTNAFKDAEDGAAQVDAIMEEVEKGVEAAKAAAEGSGATAQSEAETTVAAVGSIITQMENLKKAYDEAKESAKKALGSRFGLFDDTGDPAKSKTTSEIQTNLGKQQTYWEQYNTALEGVLKNGVAKEIAQQLTDGSAESLATLQTLAKATPEEVEKINAAFKEVDAAKDTLASTIADMETNFSEGMATLKGELENTVKELDKGSEAAQAAADTMAAYVEALGEAEGDASSQASAIAEAVNAALSAISDVDVDITYHYKTDGSPPADAKGGDVKGHDAIGTDYAAAGLTLVGEEGPELVMMNGGEKVLTAHETVNALSGSGGGDGIGRIEVQFSPVFNVNGGDAAGIRAAIEEQTQNMREQIIGVMEDVLTDRMRLSYV